MDGLTALFKMVFSDLPLSESDVTRKSRNNRFNKKIPESLFDADSAFFGTYEKLLQLIFSWKTYVALCTASLCFMCVYVQ